MLRCPHCASLIDPALNPSGRTEPKDWDPCQCPGCREISTFEHTVAGGLRIPNDDDWAAWRADARLAKALDVAHRVQTIGGQL